MPKLAKPLTDTQVRTAKPIEGKTHTLADGSGMYLEITASGSKIWRMSYRQESGKQNRLTVGTYPEVSLLEARAKRTQVRKLLADGIDPAQFRREAKEAKAVAATHTFEAIALTWLKKTAATRAATTQEKSDELVAERRVSVYREHACFLDQATKCSDDSAKDGSPRCH